MDKPMHGRTPQLPLAGQPDPTEQTTRLIDRAVLCLREVLEERFQTVKQRFEGMDKAISLIQVEADKVPSKTDVAVTQLRALQDERFTSIDVQFKERDTRTDQTSRDNKVAIDAALQAQKEAVGKQNESNALAIAKSEAAFTKQIDAIITLLQTMTKGFDDKIEDIKTRLTLIEGRTSTPMVIVGIIIGAVALLGVVVNVFMNLQH